MPLGFVIFYLQHFGESKDFHQTSNGFYFLNIQVLHSLDILKQEDMGGVIISAVLPGGGGSVIWIFQNGGRKFCMKSSI